MTFSLDIRAHSEIGLVRKNNQDSGYASPTMLVVADGMGGAAAGDLASTVAVLEVQKADRAAEGEDLVSLLAGAVSRANDTIADLVAADHALDGMGTTVCGAMMSGTQMGLVHIGDSRGYLLRDNELRRLTHDHSWVQSLIDDGRITEEEAAIHPHRSLVLKVLNGHPTHQPDTALIDLELGDRILFCSDGLCGFTTDEVIGEALAEDDLDVVLNELVKAAHHGGGADNITIVLAEVVEQDDALDAAAAQVLGAASETDVPTGSSGAAVVDLGDDGPQLDDGSHSVPKAPAPRPAVDDRESARYSPTLARKRRWAPLVLTLVLLLATGGALWGGWAWSKTQYYVGQHGDVVAIFNGVEGAVLGQPLSTLTETSDIKVAGLPRFYRQQVTDTIRTSTLESARGTVERLRSYANTCDPTATTPQPSGSGSATRPPATSASAAPSTAVSSPASGTPSLTPPPGTISRSSSPPGESDC